MSKQTTPAPVVVVLLRRPRPASSHPQERRSDPFWEFGSFGLTGCHCRNLMHPKNADDLQGKRLAFVQGGKAGFKLVYLTPPVAVRPYKDRCEASWSNPSMPFSYSLAPLVVDSRGYSDMPLILDMFRDVKRSGWEGRFASRFRSRTAPLPAATAGLLTAVYQSARDKARSKPEVLAVTYNQALPWDPPLVDTNRLETYNHLLDAVSGK